MSNSMQELIAQRFRITLSTTIGDATFYNTTDEQLVQSGQAISPSQTAQLRQGAEDFFRNTHQQQNPIWMGKHKQSLTAIYGTALTPIESIPSLSFEDAEQLLHNLVEQIKPQPHLFSHGIRTTDLGINEDGHMIVRASGILPKINHVRPEIISTEGTPQQKALYGIAVHVFSSLSDLPSIENKRALEDFQQRPPVLLEIFPDAPESLSNLLSIMMHPSPQKREEAFSMVEQRPPLVLSIPTMPPPIAHKESSTSLPDINTRRDLPLPQWLVFSQTKSIPINVARRIAVFSGIHPNSITTNSHLYPIGGAETQEEAQRIAQRMIESGIDASVHHQDAGPKVSAVLIGTCILGLLSYLLSLGIFAIILPILLGFAISIVIGFFSSNKKQQYYKKWNKIHNPASVHKSILQGQQMTQNTRKSIMNSAVPELAKIDLHASIDEIDDILDGYHETQTPIPSDMLDDIHTTCSELIAELGKNNQQENRILNIRKRTQQVQRIARKMRSI